MLGMDVIWTAEYAAQGWLLDVTEALNERKDEFIPATVETTEYEGKNWAIPFNTNAGFIYWRTDEAGDQPPQSWEDMYSTAQQDNGIVYQGAQYEGLTVNFLRAALQRRRHRGRTTTPRRRRPTRRRRATCSSSCRRGSTTARPPRP